MNAPDINRLFKFVINPRKTWLTRPSHKWGFGILVLVAFELSLGMRLKREMGLDISLVGQTISTILVILIIEAIIIQTSAQISSIFEKKASKWNIFTLFHFSLTPFLLILPLTLLLWTSSRAMLLQSLLILLVGLKTFQNWKAIIEVSFKLKPWQGAIVVACLGIGLYLLLPLWFSLTLLGRPD